ncbi:hypothetical protein CDAR_60111 [Caerostris darwini]|uniref:Uncharacterized protein n=1 Tax=Caerostris darwini TaxID=1538125 RepID=A0AAV4QMZ6_9ARAC|nr:hypothetical protein CDAR_60111 [Caerostris darwini]
MSNSCRQESLRLSLGEGAFYLHLKRSLSNSIPQGMKSIRREWKCGSLEEQSGFFEQDRCCSFLPHSYSITLSISTPPPQFEPFCQKWEEDEGYGLSFCWRKFLKSVVCIRDFSNQNGRRNIKWKTRSWSSVLFFFSPSAIDLCNVNITKAKLFRWTEHV